MQRSHAPAEKKRFVGIKKTKVFHDALYGELTDDDDVCRIDLSPEDIRTFDPDTPLEAVLEGFSPCPKCLWPKRSHPE